MRLKTMMAALAAASALLLPSAATAGEQQIGNSVWSFDVYENETGELEATVNGYRQVDQNGNRIEPQSDFTLTVPGSFTVTWTNEYVNAERVYYEYEDYYGYTYTTYSNKYVTVRGPEIKSATATVTGVYVYNDYNWVWVNNPETGEWDWGLTYSYLGKLTALTLPSTVEWVTGFNYCTNLTSVTMSEKTHWNGTVFSESPYRKNLGEFVIRDGVLVAYQGEAASVTVPDGVREIGDSAFANAPTNLTSVALPASVKVIGDYAFGGCENLTTINLPEGVTYIGDGAFEDCYSLTTITIPSRVKYIGSYAFAYTAISSVNVPEGVKSLYNSFSYCTNLTAVTLPTSLKSISAFEGCSALATVTLPNGLEYLGSYTFYNCTNLTSVTLPASVKEIGYSAFERCSALAAITLPNGIKYIDSNAFEGCKALASISIPNSVEEIGSYAFERCTALTSISIPDSVETISYGAFYGCTNLVTVTGGRGVTYANRWVFESTALESKWPEDGICQAGTMVLGCNGTLPEKLVIPAGVTYISENAFRYQSQIKELEIPASVHTIGEEAFEGCYNLTNVTGGAGLRTVGYDAFYDTPYGDTFWDDRGNKDVPFGYVRLGSVVFGYKGVCPAVVSIPDDVTQIEYSLFDHDYDDSVTNITSAVIGAKLEKLPRYAFYAAENLKNVTGGASLTVIERYAFYACYGLTAFAIPANVQGIQGGAFSYCTNLVTVTGGGSLNYMDTPFYDCPSLTDVSLAGPMSDIYLFDGSTTNIVNVTFNLPEDVYDEYGEFSLSSSMFDDLNKLESVNVFRTGYELVNWTAGVNGPFYETFANELATFKLYCKEWYGDGNWGARSLRFYPVWKRVLRNVETDGAFSSADKTVYQGWLTDEAGNVIGSVTVTAAKGKNGESKTKVAVQILGERKVNLNGTIDANGAGTGALAGLVLGANGMSGTLKVNGKTYTADGARDVNKTKQDAEQTTLAKLKGKAWTVVLAPTSPEASAYANGYLGFSITMGMKGKAKITGVLPDGVKVAVNAQAIVGGTGFCIPVVFSKKDAVGFLFWLDLEGNAKDVTSISNWKSTAIRGAAFTVPLEMWTFSELAPLSGTVPFSVSSDDLPASLTGAIADYLPEYEPVTVTGNKWTLAKPAMIKYTKGAFDQAAYDKGVAQGKTNVGGVKLSYVAKSGSFKGSFTIYTLTGGKLKKVKATVNGVVSGGIGYGAAQIKKFGSMPVVIGEVGDY